MTSRTAPGAAHSAVAHVVVVTAVVPMFTGTGFTGNETAPGTRPTALMSVVHTT